MIDEKNFLPMSETAYYILLSLLQEQHGYAVMQYVAELTHNRIHLGAGTLYGTLSKLQKGGLIMTTKEEEKRKYYRITDSGKDILRQELARLKELYLNGKKEYQDGI